jgi:hypothetical protein
MQSQQFRGCPQGKQAWALPGTTIDLDRPYETLAAVGLAGGQFKKGDMDSIADIIVHLADI